MHLRSHLSPSLSPQLFLNQQQQPMPQLQQRPAQFQSTAQISSPIQQQLVQQPIPQSRQHHQEAEESASMSRAPSTWLNFARESLIRRIGITVWVVRLQSPRQRSWRNELISRCRSSVFRKQRDQQQERMNPCLWSRSGCVLRAVISIADGPSRSMRWLTMMARRIIIHWPSTLEPWTAGMYKYRGTDSQCGVAVLVNS